MDDQELLDLQNPETWADDEGEVRTSVVAPRVVLAVAFTADDFEQIARAARQRGVKTTEFVRDAAMSRATDQPIPAVVASLARER